MASPKRLNSRTLIVPLPSLSSTWKISDRSFTFASESAMIKIGDAPCNPGLAGWGGPGGENKRALVAAQREWLWRGKKRCGERDSYCNIAILQY